MWGTWLLQQPPQLLEGEVLADIARTECPLVIVDPLRYAHACDENDSGEMASVMQACRSLTIHGATVVLLHHPAKQEGSTGRGSTAIRGAVDIALLQELSEKTELITLKATKNRFGDRFSVTMRPNWEAGTFEVIDSPQFTKRRDEIEKIRAIIEQQRGLTQNGVFEKSGMGRNRVVALLREHAGVHWEQREEGRSLRYFPLVLGNQYNPQYNSISQNGEDCTAVLPPLGSTAYNPPSAACTTSNLINGAAASATTHFSETQPNDDDEIEPEGTL
jgi:archaellum biogenesis ATPase FlaH